MCEVSHLALRPIANKMCHPSNFLLPQKYSNACKTLSRQTSAEVGRWGETNAAVACFYVRDPKAVLDPLQVKVLPNLMHYFPQKDWTWGCIAVRNIDIDEIWQLVNNDTVIEIHP